MFKGHGGNIKRIIQCIPPGTEDKNNGIIDFSASINPLGYPKNVRKVILENFDDIVHYPDIDCIELRTCIAQKTGHSDDEIIVGNGSTELFYLIPRTLRPTEGITFQPTFSEFAEALKCSHAKVIHNVLSEENDFCFQYHEGYFHDKKGGVAFLCNPNNPTGQLIESTVILNMVNKHSGITFVVDEAFIDFVDEPGKYTVINEVGKLQNLIVVRSLTKFYGFPGLRIGYLAANRELVMKMMEHKEPWSVNTLAQYAAIAALEDEEFISRSREFMSKERLFLYNEISHIRGFLPYKPTVNYILIKIDTMDMTSSSLREQLLGYGIAIRDCSNFVGLGNKYFRVAVRTREENIKLIHALKSVAAQTIRAFVTSEIGNHS